MGAKKLVADAGGALIAGGDGLAKKLGTEVLCGGPATGVAAVEDVLEADFVGGANENGSVEAFAESVPVADVDGATGFGAMVVTVGPEDGVAVAPGFAGSAVAAGGFEKSGGVGLGTAAGDGGVLDPTIRCLSLIFNMAAASRSCFSHLEYDFVFCNMGLSVAGEDGAVNAVEMRRVDTAG